ncbi:unnamed protein product [Pleuronectes platessa]|uniref:Uncharacterized protein n=1 Tax=Pleuronectes platessa TaxID=8262 RepID=A0A9N7Y4K2_PLEPL|nr:unnamed protein product [Pleuronectes platessa]
MSSGDICVESRPSKIEERKDREEQRVTRYQTLETNLNQEKTQKEESYTETLSRLWRNSKPECSWEDFPPLRSGGGVLDGEQSRGAVVDGDCGLEVGVGGLLEGCPPPSSSSSSFSFYPTSQNEPATIGQLPKPPSDNNTGEKKPPVKQQRGGESFDGHHCGNVGNCAFLRPWESHTRAGTCGDGKRGRPLTRAEMSDGEQHHLITWSAGAGKVLSIKLAAEDRFPRFKVFTTAVEVMRVFTWDLILRNTVSRFSCEASVQHHIKSTISSTEAQIPDLLERAGRVKKDV